MVPFPHRAINRRWKAPTRMRELSPRRAIIFEPEQLRGLNARAPYLRQFPMGGSSALRRHFASDLLCQPVVLALVWTFMRSSGRGEESIALREEGISTSFPRGFGILINDADRVTRAQSSFAPYCPRWRRRRQTRFLADISVRLRRCGLPRLASSPHEPSEFPTTPALPGRSANLEAPPAVSSDWP